MAVKTQKPVPVIKIAMLFKQKQSGQQLPGKAKKN